MKSNFNKPSKRKIITKKSNDVKSPYYNYQTIPILTYVLTANDLLLFLFLNRAWSIRPGCTAAYRLIVQP